MAEAAEAAGLPNAVLQMDEPAPPDLPDPATADLQSPLVSTPEPFGGKICKLKNTLTVAIEVRLNEDSQGEEWHVLYPDQIKTIEVEASLDPQLSVRLREDYGIQNKIHIEDMFGILNVPQDLGDSFRDKAKEFIDNQEGEAEEERRLAEKRQKAITKKVNDAINGSAHRRQGCLFLCTAICLSVLLGLIIVCTIAAFSFEPGSFGDFFSDFFEEESEGMEVGLEIALLAISLVLLSTCACAATRGFIESPFLDRHLQSSIRATGSELQNFEASGMSSADGDGVSCRFFLSRCCYRLTCLIPFVCVICFFCRDPFSSLVVFFPSIVFLLCMLIIYTDVLPGLLDACYCGVTLEDLLASLVQPPERALDAAVLDVHERTIVFEGSVLPNEPTVVSWPGKYESKWESLVVNARQKDVSAAVVFLPEGSQHFGVHDSIPHKYHLRPYHPCWCYFLYGERKPWGCRWWTHWVHNVELAVKNHATLEVYFFDGKKGKGKVENFATAGEEHKRREAIFKQKNEFLTSVKYGQALADGLGRISKQKGSDSSSPFSREVDRLFLRWLPERDRRFLEDSEGLGNSQKAEVAWLEKQGYAYIEKEVAEFGSGPTGADPVSPNPSPQAIGRGDCEQQLLRSGGSTDNV